MRKLTILNKASGKISWETNKVLIEQGGSSYTAHWSDTTLQIEQMRDKLIASGANESMIDDFREMVYDAGHDEGYDEGRSEWH